MIKELQLRVLPKIAASEDALIEYLSKEHSIAIKDIKAVRILKRSIDARQRQVMINLKVNMFINELPSNEEFVSIEYRDVSSAPSVIVVGAGPAGLFAALRLIEAGLRPIVVERGKPVAERKRDIALISREHSVDPESNYSFGEGGAGAFSDGKLYTRSKKRGSVDRVLNILCQHGASTSILVDAHPHIGTDKLPRVISNIRETILSCGGEVRFNTKMKSLIIEENQVKGIICNDDNELHGKVILATGHSARDVYRHLNESQVLIESKAIAVGVRLEHPQELIDQIQYHSKDGRGDYLPAAEYSFVTQSKERGVYSFCMCPGGVVVPAATGPNQVVVNGMSSSSRGSRWANSGMVVEVRPEDLPSHHAEQGALSMLSFQEELERNCWQNGGMKQTAPAQRMVEFVNKKLSGTLPESSYSPGLLSSPLHFWMPEIVTDRLREGFKKFGQMSHGFLTDDAVMIGVESRTSSPVRIPRDRESLEHLNIRGLYPCGEGAGYAGGIVSAAIDGERCAEALAATL
ncbi:MAG: NAD(P)/FAD-dependent oxidoreductase [Bacteroidales bacterium]